MLTILSGSSSSHRFAISAYYQDVHHILLGQIDQTPTLKEYVVLLEDMVSEITLPDNDKLQDVLKVYAMLGRKCVEISSKESSNMPDFG